MARYYSNSSKIMKIIVGLIVVALICTVVALAVKLSRSTNEKIGFESYSICSINEDGMIETNSEVHENATIATKKGISVDGFTLKLTDESNVEYRLFFYGAKGAFISSTEEYSSGNFNASLIPEDAKTVKVMIRPTDDEEISFDEIYGYANQVIVTTNR